MGFRAQFLASPRTFYHVTESDAAADILKNGFAGGWGDAGYGVYLYGTPYSAEEYAARGGWDGELKDPVAIEVKGDDIRKVPILDPSWDPHDYEDMYMHPMGESDDERWKPRMRIIG